jgi:hypothetical protein
LHDELEQLLLGRRFVQRGRLDLVDQAAAAVRALVPGVHGVEHGVALVDGEHRALDARLRSGPVTTTAISMRRSFSGSRPLISQSSQTRFWSFFFRVGGGRGRRVKGSGIAGVDSRPHARTKLAACHVLFAHLHLAFAAALLAGLLVKFWLASRQVRHVARHRGAVPGPFAADRVARRAPEGRRLHRRQVALRPARDGLERGRAAGMDAARRPDALNQLLLGWLGGGMVQQLALLAAFACHRRPAGPALHAVPDLRLEERFGFNKMTFRLWLADAVKGHAAGRAIGLPIAASSSG